jgi:Transglutaminase elicitor
MVVALGNHMKIAGKALAINAQNTGNTNEIWNQPAYRYEVYRYKELSASEAAALVSKNATRYKWNPDAQAFVLVDIGVKWVTERGPNVAVISGTRSTEETRFVAVLELDAPTSATNAQIIGGEYIDDPSVGANRLTVAPFVWISHDTGYDNLPTWVGGNNHNPYLKFSLVKQLVALGN